MRRRVAALAAALPLLLASCGGSDGESTASSGGTAPSGGAQETVDVTVGVIPIVDVAPIYLGVEQGFFEDRGLNLTLESGQGGAAIVPGVVSGQFQFGFSNVTSLLLARSNGLPLKIVTNGAASTGLDGEDFGGVLAQADSGISDAADLAGKRVAVNTLNNIGTTTIRESVRQAGGDPDEVTFVELPFPDMPAALEQGNVDAIWVVEPFFTIAQDGGAELVASNYVDPAENLTVATYFTSEQYTQQNSDVVDRFTEAMNESLEYADANPDAVRETLQTYTQIDPAVAAKLTLPKWPAEINRESVQTLADLAVSDELLDAAPDLDELLP
jgi:NitT/TauT family transport system substrate-binding protein